MMKNVQQMRTMFPMGLREDRSVWTTSFKPGALLMTLRGRSARTKRKTRKMSNIFEPCPKTMVMRVSTTEMRTSDPSIMFHPDLKYACSPYSSPVATA